MLNDLEKEMKMFREICSDKDYELIVNNEIKSHDFFRINSILTAIKFDFLQVYFFNKHCEKFKGEIEYIYNVDDDIQEYADIELYEEWVDKFVEDIEDEVLKQKIVERMNRI